MGQKSKFLVTSEGNFDLSTYTWDDQLFTDILIRENPIDSAQAMGISRSLREDISKLEITTIPVSFIEKMIEAKLMEFGIRADQTLTDSSGQVDFRQKPPQSFGKRHPGFKKALSEKKPQR